MIKHDQGITCTLMTILLIASLSYLSINAQISHAIEATTDELVVVQDLSHAPNPAEHNNFLIGSSFQNASPFPLGIFTNILSSEHGLRIASHLWHYAPSYWQALLSNR
jgi:hypothetical protein